MPEQTGNHRRARRAVLLPIIAFVVIAAIIVGVAVWSRGGSDVTTSAPAAGESLAAADDSTSPTPTPDPKPTYTKKAAEVQVPEGLLKRARAELAMNQPITTTVGSFNILATQHTDAGGAHASWPSWTWRTPQAAALIRAHGVDVVGLQEVKPVQLDMLMRLTGFDAYPGHAFGPRNTDNSILYDPAVWEYVEGTSFPITFMNAVRPQTVLRLKHRATGREVYFINMHTSAGDGRYRVSRLAGMDKAIGYINALKSEGLPIFLTGDMNDREVFFCRVLPPTGMVASVGGSTAGGCRPPARMPVDWVVATPQVSFSNYRLDESPVNRRISDHFFISATGTVGAG